MPADASGVGDAGPAASARAEDLAARLHALAGSAAPEPAVLDELAELVGRALAERDAALAALRREKEFTEGLIESSTDGILAFDRECCYTAWNAAMERISGKTKEEVLGKCAFDVFPFLIESGEYRNFFGVFEGKTVLAQDRPYTLPDGQPGGVFEGLYSPVRNAEGKIVGGIATIRDVTDRRLTEQALAESHERFRQLTEHIREGFWISTPKRDSLIYVSPAYEALWGVTRQELQENPRRFLDVIVTEDRARVAAALEQPLEREFEHEFRIRRADGEVRWIRDRAFAVLNEHGELYRIAGVSEDITERKLVEDRLERQAAELRSLSLVDELTGVYNRRGFLTLAEKQLKLADRSRRGLFLLFADVDRLKQINDEHGHVQGDRALLDVADLFRGTFRESDIIARLGGDEFAVLAVDTGEQESRALLERLQARIRAHNRSATRPFPLSISMGMVYYQPKSAILLEDLLARADRMMYHEKWSKQES